MYKVEVLFLFKGTLKIVYSVSVENDIGRTPNIREDLSDDYVL